MVSLGDLILETDDEDHVKFTQMIKQKISLIISRNLLIVLARLDSS